MKNEIVQAQSSELILAKTKKLMGFTQKILSKQSALAVKKEDKALAQALIAGRYRDEGKIKGVRSCLLLSLEFDRL